MKEATYSKGLLGEVWDFLRVRKKWWLLPIIIMLVLLGVLIVVGQSSALSPFIYVLFWIKTRDAKAGKSGLKWSSIMGSQKEI